MFTPIVVVLALVLLFLIIGIILALIPIRYRAKASTGEDGHTARAKVTYLFGLVNFWFVYKDGEVKKRLRIAGLTVWGTKKKPPPGSVPKETAVYVPKAVQLVEADDEDDIVPKVERAAPIKPPLKERFNSAKERFFSIKKQISEVIHHPDRKRITKWIWRAIKKTIKALKPKRIEISGTVGFADPATTAQLVGGISVFATIWQLQEYIRIKPKMEADKTEISLCANVQGSISLAKLLSPNLGLGIKLGMLMLIRKIQNKVTKRGRKK